MNERRGVVTAFVKQTDAKQGRVVVEYRSIDDNLESTWAPIASPMSGKGRGALFMPEQGDEVLVAFLDGKFDSPYVVGFLCEIKSTQHSVTLDDAPAAPNIAINAGSGGMVSIKLNTTPPSITISTGAGTISMDATGVTVTSPGSLTINAGSVAVNSTAITFNGAVQCSALTAGTVQCGALTAAVSVTSPLYL